MLVDADKVFPDLFAGSPDLLADPTGKKWYDMVQEGGQSGVDAALESGLLIEENGAVRPSDLGWRFGNETQAIFLP